MHILERSHSQDKAVRGIVRKLDVLGGEKFQRSVAGIVHVSPAAEQPFFGW
jgi:hypothetical protein